MLKMSYDDDQDDDETICLSEPKILPSKDGEANPLMDELLEDNTEESKFTTPTADSSQLAQQK